MYWLINIKLITYAICKIYLSCSIFTHFKRHRPLIDFILLKTSNILLE